MLGLIKESEDKSKLDEYLRSVGSDNWRAPLRVALIPDGVRRDYKLSATPITLIVASNRKVEHLWEGRWSVDDAASAASVFGFDFPALSENKN